MHSGHGGLRDDSIGGSIRPSILLTDSSQPVEATQGTDHFLKTHRCPFNLCASFSQDWIVIDFGDAGREEPNERIFDSRCSSLETTRNYASFSELGGSSWVQEVFPRCCQSYPHSKGCPDSFRCLHCGSSFEHFAFELPPLVKGIIAVNPQSHCSVN